MTREQRLSHDIADAVGPGVFRPDHGFDCPECRRFARPLYFSRVSDPSKWEGLGPGINLGHPAIARFAARWLNAALDFWRNW